LKEKPTLAKPDLLGKMPARHAVAYF